MANTNVLKTVVEQELVQFFCQKNKLEPINLKKSQVKDIFSGMEPDLIAYNPTDKTLVIGEVTTSGYMGQKGKDFHVGAVKKVFEAFSKFYLFYDDFENISRACLEKKNCTKYDIMILVMKDDNNQEEI